MHRYFNQESKNALEAAGIGFSEVNGTLEIHAEPNRWMDIRYDGNVRIKGEMQGIIYASGAVEIEGNITQSDFAPEMSQIHAAKLSLSGGAANAQLIAIEGDISIAGDVDKHCRLHAKQNITIKGITGNEVTAQAENGSVTLHDSIGRGNQVIAGNNIYIHARTVSGNVYHGDSEAIHTRLIAGGQILLDNKTRLLEGVQTLSPDGTYLEPARQQSRNLPTR